MLDVPEDETGVEVIVLNDKSTPYSFVVDLLQSTFGKSRVQAQVIASEAHHFGESTCGVWPQPVADALLSEAQDRVARAEHSLAFAIRTAGGHVVHGQDQCGFCGKPANQTAQLYRSGGTVICDACVLDATERLRGAAADADFRHAHQALDWHFAGRRHDDLVTAVRTYPQRMRADIQRALDTVFEPHKVRQFGIRVAYRHDQLTFADLLEKGHGAKTLMPIQYEEVDIGEDQPVRCVEHALCLLGGDGLPHAALATITETTYGVQQIRFEIAVPVGDAGRALTESYFAAIDRAITEARSYRGKVLSLESAYQWSGMAGGIHVHRLAPLPREEVVLPETTLRLIDRNVIAFAAYRGRFVARNQSAKKGLLFYGLPGTGKTHTIRYLAGNLPGHTTLLMTAEQVGLLKEYFSLARLLQPSVLVVEDADLIARQREAMGGACEETLLNQLLNEMDGLREDAEIFFILTTNRPEQIEGALAARPGRIDQAIEFPLPDADGRDKLIRLYAGDLQVPDDVVAAAAQRTNGVSAAFIKELMRRTAQAAFERGAADAVSLADVEDAIGEMVFDGGQLNARLLGGRLTPSEAA